MKNYKAEREFDLNEKRFYLPIEVKLNCPHCENEVVHDLDDDYLSYPTVNKAETIGLYCNKCESEFECKATIRISLEVNDENLTLL